MITQLARRIAQTRRVRFGSKAAIIALRQSIALGQERSSYSVESAVRYAAWDDAVIGGDIAMEGNRRLVAERESVIADS